MDSTCETTTSSTARIDMLEKENARLTSDIYNLHAKIHSLNTLVEECSIFKYWTRLHGCSWHMTPSQCIDTLNHTLQHTDIQ
jgi:hypothetical protein